VRAGLPRRHQDAYLSGKHGNRLALLLGSSHTAAGTPETGSYVLAGDLNPHEQTPAAGPSQAEVLRVGTAAHRGHDRAASWPIQVALCDPRSLTHAHVADLGGNLERQSDCRYRARTAVRLTAGAKQALASLPLAGHACIAAAQRFTPPRSPTANDHEVLNGFGRRPASCPAMLPAVTAG
jgi:hypothetical protein